ncbi:MAG: hypothetical protein EOS04_21140 [Mesorhizobium sp.]|nr:MAG: hypothetical protein EOR98_20960 [Mesorhizobium sp.]RWN78433.1 MAG: hypothetical protein EOS01_16575 [Mesorhizobium sp.]RWN81037.1 MAG: hypothetical protein EOS02_03945 [Mesorhizobium sp.]RWN85824.1 MAG: hypothetical protein EOS04_21140 [Mesorhizobium sp.]RWO16249.1 MAG: hypothetical protein EOS15_04430 [Mesorhizobium sp.]
MIYVRRDSSLIPEKILKVAERAQATLEGLPEGQRADFIKKKSHVWRSFSKYLRKMSYGKCWYSESDDPQSFFDVDHFRPKLEAIRDDKKADGGYPWLAFSWDNFRYAAGRSNRLSSHEETDEVSGKGSWFPLAEGSPTATWDNRCTGDEKPLLLDPIIQDDADLLAIDVKNKVGHISPSMLCIGKTSLARVERTAQLYGLDLPNLVSARKRVMREVTDLYDTLLDLIAAGTAHPTAGDMLPVHKLKKSIKGKTMPSSRFSKAARAQLWLLPGGAELCAQPEEFV